MREETTAKELKERTLPLHVSIGLPFLTRVVAVDGRVN